MSISKDELLKRKTELEQGSKELQQQIDEGEKTLKQLRNNLNAMAGAAQQVDLFMKQIEEKGEPMPPEKAQALDIATS